MADTENTEIVNEEVEQLAEGGAPEEQQVILSQRNVRIITTVDLAVSRGASRGAEAPSGCCF